MASTTNLLYGNESVEPLLLNGDAEVEVAIHYPYTEVKVYRRRWVILLAFSLLGFIQGAIWNTWGPISTSAKIVFPGWTDATIALLSNWGNICYVLFLIPVVWVMDSRGLRNATLLASFLVFVGAGIRCFTLNPAVATWFIHAGHFINGVAGIVVFAGPPQVSAAWFPPHQRTTATGLIYMISSLGIAAGSLIPPLIVAEVDASIVFSDKHNLENQVLRLMYLQFAFATVMFLWILIYFPAKPAFPPSISASVERVHFVTGLKMSCRNKDIWFVGMSFGISTAVYGCWITVIHINLEVLGIDQKEAGWIGCYSLLGGCAGTFISSRATDFIGGKMKCFLIVGLIGGTMCFLWFAGICLHLLPDDKPSLYTSVILGGALNSGLQPIFMELGAEVAYPIGEAIVGGFLTGIFNVIGTIFLLLFFIPNIGYIWMNWCLIGSTILGIPFLMFAREHYARSEIDTQRRSFTLQS